MSCVAIRTDPENLFQIDGDLPLTNGEAKRKGHAGGYVLRTRKAMGFELYLADYLHGHKGRLTTPYPAEAEWFQYEHQAREVAKRAAFYSGRLAFEVTSVPADARPCRCKAEAHYLYPNSEPCPHCGSIRTAKVVDYHRCFTCDNAWPAVATFTLGPEDDGLTDEQASMAFRAAAETVFPELDDDALDAIEAEMRNVGGVFVP
jgi:hypothetical protein